MPHCRHLVCTLAALPGLLLAAAPAPAAHTASAKNGPAPQPSACAERLRALARFTPLPPIDGPGQCQAADVVRLVAVVLPDRSQVELDPPATLRCDMAEAVSEFVRSELAPIAADLGARLAAVSTADSYDCRPRNGERGAKISEHGRANALDISALKFTDGTVVALSGPELATGTAERIRIAACRYFTTVLGPGADSHHGGHIHLDRLERRGGYRLCQWDVSAPSSVANVPLPPRKPKLTNGAAPKPRLHQSRQRRK